MDEKKKVHPIKDESAPRYQRIKKSDIASLKSKLPKKVDLDKSGGVFEERNTPKVVPVVNVAEIDDSEGITPILENGANEISVPLNAENIRAFQIYAHMLREWNKVMNLTNITDDDGIAMRHFIDSLTLVSYINSETTKRKKKDLSIIDVGTGAGFPGISLRVVFPDLKLTLLDSLAKRITFLDSVCTALELSEVKTIHSRAEDAGRDKKLREKYDIATARAVAALPTLCEYCLPFVKVGGIFIAMKGHSEEELDQSAKAIAAMGGTLEKTVKFRLPGTDMDRSVIVIRKLRPTPPIYPRQAGKPGKEPIVK